MTILAGKPNHKGFVDGIGAAARFNHPYGIAVDEDDNIYVSDRCNERIRKITWI